MPTLRVPRYAHKGHWPVTLLLSCPVTTSTLEEATSTQSKRFSCVSVALPQPTLFITLTVKAKYEHTYEYMNNWTSGHCYSPAHTLTSLPSLLFPACSSAEHGLSDRVSELGQRGVGAQVFVSGSFTEKEWPVSANAPSVCLRSFLLCPCTLFLQWLPCWHKKPAICPDGRQQGSPTRTHTHILCQWSVWDAALLRMHHWKEWLEVKRWASVLMKATKAIEMFSIVKNADIKLSWSRIESFWFCNGAVHLTNWLCSLVSYVLTCVIIFER